MESQKCYCTNGARQAAVDRAWPVGRLLRKMATLGAFALVFGGLGPFAGAVTPIAAADEPQPRIAPLVWDDVQLAVDSGQVAHDGVAAGAQPVFSEVIDARDAVWMRLEFGEVQLTGSSVLGNNTFLRITSLADGAQQILDSRSIQQWGHTSAYFNGSAVLVELFAHPGTPASRVTVSGYQHGLIGDDATLSLCDGTDTRQLVTAAPDARLLPVGCTGWLIGEQCFVSAGHCQVLGNVAVAEFNVPMSNTDGSINFAHPDNQYTVDTASRQWQYNSGNPHNGCADDWMHFGVFPNSNTGLTPLQAQGEFYTLASSIPTPSNQTIRVRGYGSTLGFPLPNTWSQVLKISTGPFVAHSGTLLQYRVDASGGDSGSALYNTVSGTVIGILTCTGCSDSWPAYIGNRGTAITHPNLQAALANPQGVCVATGPTCPPSNESCYATGGPGCEDTDCCELVCAQDSFCCNNSWDGLCVDQAVDLCFGCGHPEAGDCCEANGSPHCEDFACCQAVCDFDPYCCDTTWDSICADGATNTTECSCGPTPSNCPADLNGDGEVNALDLLILLAAWGTNPGHPADLNGDNEVNALDLLILLAAWGPCPPKGACDTPFVCDGSPVPWCDEAQTCACIADYDGVTHCVENWACTGETCDDGNCPAGHICVVDSCCGPTTCVPVEHICDDEPEPQDCDEGFVCGGPITWCNGAQTCVCFYTFSGGIRCLSSEDVTCQGQCPNGSCPDGQICVVDTCCNGGAPTCIFENPCPTCDEGFVCGEPIPWCNEPDQCLCMTTFSGSIECIQNTGCGQTCPAGTCPSGQICVVDTCCNGGAATCITPTYCEVQTQVCDDLFECGVPFPDGYCEEGCICVETAEGTNECLNGNAPCGAACTAGSCGAGQVCVLNTCCGASNCVDVAWLDCGSPAAGSAHDGPTVGGKSAIGPLPDTRPVPQPSQPGNTTLGDQQPFISPRGMSQKPAQPVVQPKSTKRESGLGTAR